MHIFIMRHGEAELAQQNDRGRQLTAYGRQQSRQSGKWLKDYCQKQILTVDCALVSPYRRAEQTFSEMAKFVPSKRVLSSSDIVPSGDIKMAQAYVDFLISEQPELSSMILVSHMPFVSFFLDQLCAEPRSMLFSTAAIVVVEYDSMTGGGHVLEQFIPD